MVQKQIIGEFDVKNSKEEQLRGVKIDNKRSFENHIFHKTKS